MRRNEQEE